MSKSKIPYEKKVEIARDYLEGRVGYTESLGRANIRAKHPGFLPRSLNQGCATVLTYLFNTARVLGSNYATQGISLAVTVQVLTIFHKYSILNIKDKSNRHSRSH